MRRLCDTTLGSRNCWGARFPSLPQDLAYQQLPLGYYHYLDTAITLMMKRHYPGRRTIIMNHHFGMFYNCAKLIGCNSCLSNHQTHSYSGWQTRVSELNSFLEDNDQHLENPEDIGSSGSAHGNAILTCIDCTVYTPAGSIGSKCSLSKTILLHLSLQLLSNENWNMYFDLCA